MTRRMSRPRLLSALALSAALTFALAACSSGEGEQPSADAELSELAAQLPESIIEQGFISNLVMIPAPPFEYEDEETGELAGIDIELLDRLSEVIGFPIETSTITDFAQLIPSLQSGRADMVMSGVWDTTARQELVTMVDYLQTGMGVVVRQDADYTSIEDLCGKTIVVGTGTAYVDQIPELATEACGDPEGFEVLVMSGAFNELATQLETGRADAVADGFDFQGYQISQNYSDTLEILNETPLYPALYGAAVNLDLPELVDVIQQGLQIMVDDGSYLEILTGWGQEGGALQEITVNAGTT